MARRVHHAGFEGADRERLAVLEQLVELAPVRSEARFRVEDLLEHALHDVDAGADGGAAAELCLQIRRGGQVVGVQVGLEDPVDRQRSEEHTSELQSLMRISYAVFCLKKKTDMKK